MASFLHELLMYRDWLGVVISQKEDKVDDGGNKSSWGSVLGKMRYMYERLPEWIKQDMPLEFSFRRVRNLKMGGVLMGETSAPDAGRGPGFRRALMDEAAYIPHGEAVFGGLRSACPQGAVLASTPNGKGNVFYRLRSAEGTTMRLLRLHWSKHPERACDCEPGQHSGCWYANECEVMTPLQIARELDISYESSVAGRVWYGWSDDFVGDVERIEGLPIYRGWDLGVGDHTVIYFAQVVPLHLKSGRTTKQLRIFDAYRNHDQGYLHYREQLQAKAAFYNGSRVEDYADDYSLTARASNLKSWQDNLANDQHPYKIFAQESGARRQGVSDETVIDNARKFMQIVECTDGQRRPRLLVERSLRWAIESFEGWSYPTDEEGNLLGSASAPKHDIHSHPGSAYKYLCWGVSPRSGLPEKFRAEDAAVVDRGEIFAEANW
jgi:hypothetical protein